MLYYFKLQYKRINRHLVDLGFNLIIGYAIAAFVFIIASVQLFEKIGLAQYCYAAIAIFAAYLLSNSSRVEYLKTLFPTKLFLKIRLLENLIVSLPFVGFLLYQQFYIVAFAVLIVSLLAAFFNQWVFNTFALPTPFYKKPFEFIIGFRKSWPIILLCYALTAIGISVDNFNLAAFALLLCHLVCLNFYTQPEPTFYVWIHSQKPTKFLHHKMLIAFFHSLVISLPISLMLLIGYPNFWFVVLAIVSVAILYLWLTILGKYAYYPAAINLFQLFAVALSIIFPPFLLISLPYFYIKAKQNLLFSVL